MKLRPLIGVLVLALLLAAPAAEARSKSHPHRSKLTPMIFVHGGAGSGAQFESQAQRFTSNGYRKRLIHVFEYDSTTAIANMASLHTRLDALIAEVKQQTGRAKVDVLGHSLGTTVMHLYLLDPARAANVARYVNIDGRTGTSPPGGVPTLALWAGRGTPGREITGATNVTIPNQTHVEVATSVESFREMFKFFTGREARHNIVPQRHITLEGRAQLFPENTGVGDRTLQIWEVKASTGQRKRRVATLDVAADGSWGPVRGLKSGRRYEFALLLPGSTTHHIYFEPFVRSDHLVRLLTSQPGAGVNLLIERSDRHSAVTIVRYKEFWGDQGAESDALSVNGTGIVNPATAPIDKRVIGMFAFDTGSDGVSNVTVPHPVFFSLPFLSGVDLFLPAASPPAGKVSVALRSRGRGRTRTVNFPNFPSSTDSVSVNLNDYESIHAGWVRYGRR
jgi:pimeloyl-ACP methyl ester carboxylesterase